jgi:hypothetical protein
MPRKKVKTPVSTKICTECGKEKPLSQFYTTRNSNISTDGKTVNVCKSCVKKGSYNPDGSLNIEAFQKKLMLMDKPYIPEALDSAMSEVRRSLELGKGRTDIIGCYFKNVSTLPQYTKLSFLDSMNLFNQGKSVTEAVTTTEKRNILPRNEEVYVNMVDDFVVTNDITDLFGEGYTKSQYRKMKKKFDKLKENYSIQTNLHEEALATYVRFKVKEEEATAAGDVSSADKWNRAAQDAADKAKLTPKQLTQADLQGGVTCISEISKACEQAVDIVEILPKFKYQPNDAPDFIIWCYINYARKLKGLPKCDYKEVYQFYDDMKNDYISQYGDPYGIFADDTSEKNRSAVETFIKLPKDYENGDK